MYYYAELSNYFFKHSTQQDVRRACKRIHGSGLQGTPVELSHSARLFEFQHLYSQASHGLSPSNSPAQLPSHDDSSLSAIEFPRSLL